MKRNTLLNLIAAVMAIAVLGAMTYIWKAHLLPDTVYTVKEYISTLESEGAVIRYSVMDQDCAAISYDKSGKSYTGVLFRNNGNWVIVPKIEIHTDTVKQTTDYTIESMWFSGSNYRLFFIESKDETLPDISDSIESIVIQTSDGAKAVAVLIVEEVDDEYVLTVAGNEVDID